MFLCACFVCATVVLVLQCLCMQGCVWQAICEEIMWNATGLFHIISTLKKSSILYPVIYKSGPSSSTSVFNCISIPASQTFCSSVPSLFFVVVWRGHGARHILARVQAVCGWTRCVAQAMSSLWSSVQKVPGANTTVCTLRMQECPATLLQVEQHPPQHWQSIIVTKTCKWNAHILCT